MCGDLFIAIDVKFNHSDVDRGTDGEYQPMNTTVRSNRRIVVNRCIVVPRRRHVGRDGQTLLIALAIFARN